MYRLENAKKLLSQVENKEWGVIQAERLLTLTKEGGFFDSSFINNIVSLLSPFISDWRIRQAIKLVQEYLEEKLK